MTTPPAQPDLEARIAELAQRLHYHGPKAQDQILHRALQALGDSLPEPHPRSSDEESATFWAGVRTLGH